MNRRANQYGIGNRCRTFHDRAASPCSSKQNTIKALECFSGQAMNEPSSESPCGLQNQTKATVFLSFVVGTGPICTLFWEYAQHAVYCSSVYRACLLWQQAVWQLRLVSKLTRKSSLVFSSSSLICCCQTVFLENIWVCGQLRRLRNVRSTRWRHLSFV